MTCRHGKTVDEECHECHRGYWYRDTVLGAADVQLHEIRMYRTGHGPQCWNHQEPDPFDGHYDESGY